jgi:predicted AlkP superfamily phosphohydrolase/phosphomutase
MGKEKTSGKYSKVFILGIDGMDPAVTRELINRGNLPNIKKLAQSGSFLNLNTTYPPHSPVVWTSIATGVNPGKHNIFDFIRRDLPSYMPQLALAKQTNGITGTSYESYVKGTPFWKITSGAGIPTTIIRWPVTFPPDKVKGNLLSGLGVPDIKGFLSGYTYYTSEDTEKANKVVKIEIKDNKIETFAFGPKIMKLKDIFDVKEPMQIRILDNVTAILRVSGKEYELKKNEWSNFIDVSFDLGMFKKSRGIFRAYLKRLDSFQMYITTIQIDPREPIFKISYPDSYSEDLAEEIGLYYTLGMPEETDGYVDDKIDRKAFLEQINQIEEERDKMLWIEFEVFNKQKKAVLAVVYDSSDRLQHVSWDDKVIGKRIDSENIIINPDVVTYYVKKDKLIGEILKRIDTDTLFMIISDHGFTSFERAVSVNRWLVNNGFMALIGEPKPGEEGALFRYVDWEKTKAYSLGFNGIYINLKGREEKGIVDDKKQVVSEIIEKLEGFKDEKTGKSVLNKAYTSDEVYSGDYTKNAPDIILGFNSGYRMAWQSAIGGLTQEEIYDNIKRWDGDHMVDPAFVPGVLISNVKIEGKSAKQTDIAASVLDAFGIKLPKEMEGRSLISG